MKSDLLMNFSLDKENKTVNVKRKFNAPLSNVWSAWTEAEILDQWWAPAPIKSKTKRMEFKEGGRRLYAMVTPEGDERWSFFEYTSISPKTNFKHTSTFCDADENPIPNFGSSNWSVTFSEEENATIVDIAIHRDNLAEIEQLIETGFKEGFTSAMDSLDKILEAEK
ncbi:SRPBCC family protein [Flavobacterium sp. P21]|uniref:SRPBCC family protein n=1 Tax=Flavobacterium sp. P21 TaxID=3423948 RepID=UPI003D6739FF